MAGSILKKEKQYGLMDTAGDAVKGTVNAARDVTGGAVSGVGSVLDSGGGKMVGGLAGAGTALATLGAPAAAIGGTAGAAGGAALGGTLGLLGGPVGAAIGAGLGTVAGGVLGGVGAAGLVAKGGQALGSSLTQATGEGLKGIGNSIKAHKEGEQSFSTTATGSVLQKLYGEGAPDVGDALEVGGNAFAGAELAKLGTVGVNTAKVAASGATGVLGAGSLALTAPVDKAKEIIGNSINEAETYRPKVKNAFVKEKTHSDQDFQDASQTVTEGVEKAGKTIGNGIGGAAGAAGGMIAGTAGGALAGKLGVGAINKVAGTKIGGGGKYGAIAGAIGGTILGAQKGSSLFSERVGSVMNLDRNRFDTVSKNSSNFQSLKDSKSQVNGSILEADLERASSMYSQRVYAATGELGKLGKGLLDVAKQHRGTIGEGLAAGVVMGGTGYLANKMINKEQDDREAGKTTGGMGAGTKLALGAAGTVLGGLALKKGIKYDLLGKTVANNKGIAKRAVGATMTGVGFGAGMAALPYMMQKNQQSSMQQDTGGGEEKQQGSGFAKKALLGAGLAAGALAGGHMLARNGLLTKSLKTKALNNEAKLDKFKDNAFKSVFGSEKATLRDNIKKAEEAKAAADKARNEAVAKAAGVDVSRVGPGGYVNPKLKDSPVERVLDFGSAVMGGGTQKTQRLADQLKATDSEYLQKAGQFMKDHKKTALLAAAPLGYAATMGTWEAGENAIKKPLKAIDPEAYKNEENENI